MRRKIQYGVSLPAFDLAKYLPVVLAYSRAPAEHARFLGEVEIVFEELYLFTTSNKLSVSKATSSRNSLSVSHVSSSSQRLGCVDAGE